MTKEQKDLLKELPRTSHGKALSLFLQEELADLKDVTKAKSWDDAQGRAHAVTLIKKLFNFMEDKKLVDRKKVSYT